MNETGNAFMGSASMGRADLKSMEPYQHQETEPAGEAINRRNQQKTLLHSLLHRGEKPPEMGEGCVL